MLNYHKLLNTVIHLILLYFRHLCQSLRGRHQLVAASPPDMPPIPKNELLQAYLERHRDSDFAFQHEFELLPDRFSHRTTRASEIRENIYIKTDVRISNVTIKPVYVCRKLMEFSVLIISMQTLYWATKNAKSSFVHKVLWRIQFVTIGE